MKKTDQECLLVAAVCDVRGFSKLQAHIDEFIVSTLTPRTRSSQIGQANLVLMRKTRACAEDIFEQRLRKDLGEDEANDLEYAIKSTGDGYLVAVQLEELKPNKTIEVLEIYNIEWQRVACSLAKALCELYDDSKLQRTKKGSFGHLTLSFLEEYGIELGLSAEEYERQGAFRVPGAMAMGSGTIKPRKKLLTGDGNRGDAYGHPVNVAFRLCDHAGRFDPDKETISQPVLLDRRVGRLIASSPDGLLKKRPLPLDPVTLKGMEERWCYALGKVTTVKQRPDPKRRP